MKPRRTDDERPPPKPTTAEQGAALAAAADLLRAHGYAVTTATQAAMWDRWLEESHAREHELHDENGRLMGECSWLIHKVGQLLEGSRPVWYRELRQRWNDLGHYRRPVIAPEPKLARPERSAA